ncbi:cytochrome P450 [Penicillium freii]|nr:cytochrome P450 [Penicillium freii]
MHLERLAADLVYNKLLQKRYSIIDVIEDHPIELDFGSYIDILQPLTSRQYSISSSPLQPYNGSSSSNVASITFNIYKSLSLSSHVAAGTGIAPMRAFLQERAYIAETGLKKLAPVILFYGCRDLSKDFLYNDELQS